MYRKILALALVSLVGWNCAQSVRAAQPATEPERREMLHRMLFAIYKKQGKFDEASAELSELGKLKPNDPAFPLNAGKLLVDQKKYDEALAKFDEAIKANPEVAEGYALKGSVYNAEKKYKDAVEQYTIANKHCKTGQNFNAAISVNQQLLDKQTQEKAYLDAINGKGKPKVK